MTTGRIILLNGTGSAGKTSIARSLQRLSPEPILHLGIDLLVTGICPSPWAFRERAADGFSFHPVAGADPPMTEMRTGPTGQQLVVALHESVAALAGLGHTVVVDHVLQERPWLEDCVERWQPFPVLFVGVRCPLDVLLDRVRQRPDRSGLAVGVTHWQFDRVHAHAIYDLDLDTTTLDPPACAQAVLHRLKNPEPLTAFQRLARTRTDA